MKTITNNEKNILLLAMIWPACMRPKNDGKSGRDLSHGQAQSGQEIRPKKGNCVKEVEYYESGQVKMEGPMKDGEARGEWKAYFPDGACQSIGFFKAGQAHGEATVW